jgi:hypothetical protein
MRGQGRLPLHVSTLDLNVTVYPAYETSLKQIQRSLPDQEDVLANDVDNCAGTILKEAKVDVAGLRRNDHREVFHLLEMAVEELIASNGNHLLVTLADLAFESGACPSCCFEQSEFHGLGHSKYYMKLGFDGLEQTDQLIFPANALTKVGASCSGSLRRQGSPSTGACAKGYHQCAHLPHLSGTGWHIKIQVCAVGNTQ